MPRDPWTDRVPTPCPPRRAKSPHVILRCTVPFCLHASRVALENAWDQSTRDDWPAQRARCVESMDRIVYRVTPQEYKSCPTG